MYRKLDFLAKALLPAGLLLPILGLAYYYLIHPNRNVGYAPKQPIPFSHKLHAGDLKLDCQYCHYDVSRSTHANIPSMDVCIGCHAQITSVREKESIKLLMDHYGRKDPIQWTKIHDLPDHVRFNHEPHIRKGIACQECHGQVQEMDVLTQHSNLTMGWCVNCHRDPHGTGLKGPTNCSTCHY